MDFIKRVFAIALLFCSWSALAGGFQLHEQSITYLGVAYAGTAATADPDASATYYNPAGLSLLPHNQLVASGAYVDGHIKLYNASAKNNIGGVVNASSTYHPTAKAFVPGLHLGIILNNRFVFGFGVSSPFGLSTKYGNASIARYMGTISKLNTINLNPSLSFKFNDCWAIGAGFDAMRVQGTLDGAINFGSEGYVNNFAQAWNYGYHVGLLFSPNRDTRMGLVYFSVFNPKLTGNTSTLAYPAVPAPTSVTATINLPDRLVYGITHQYDEKWAGMGEIEFVHWSRLKYLILHYNTGASSTEILHYENTMRISLGATYKPIRCAELKGGLAFDQSPVPATWRTSRLPDSDRFWIAIGGKYFATKYVSLDLAYSHLFYKGATIAEHGWNKSDTTRNLFGNYRSSTDIFGLQVTWNFI